MPQYTIRYYDDSNVRYNHELFGGRLQEANTPLKALLALSVEELRPGQFVDVRDWHIELDDRDTAAIGHSNYPGQTLVADLYPPVETD